MSALGHKRTNRPGPKSSVVRFGPKADKISGPLARQGKLVLLCNRGVRPDEHWRATRCGMVSH